MNNHIDYYLVYAAARRLMMVSWVLRFDVGHSGHINTYKYISRESWVANPRGDDTALSEPRHRPHETRSVKLRSYMQSISFQLINNSQCTMIPCFSYLRFKIYVLFFFYYKENEIHLSPFQGEKTVFITNHLKCLVSEKKKKTFHELLLTSILGPSVFYDLLCPY